MKLKKVTFTLIGLLLFLSFMLLFYNYQKDNKELALKFDVLANNSDDYQLFYRINKNQAWSEKQSIHNKYDKPKKWESLKFTLPYNTKDLRLDLGNKQSIIKIKNVQIIGSKKFNVSIDKLVSSSNAIASSSYIDETLVIQTKSEDPYLILNNKLITDDLLHGISVAKGVLLIVVSIVMSLCCLFILNAIKDVYMYLKEIYNGKSLIFSLAKNDFKTKYASSYLGIVWGFIQPLLTIATYWFVFQVGLRSGNIAEVPFILWFIVAIVPWFFFSEALSSATNVYTEYSYLVKKVVFKIELLPMVKLVSALFVHLFFILFIFIVYTCYGYFPTIYNLQLIYYVVCSIVLSFSLSLLTSAIVLFFKDLNQIINIILQIGFWFTPIGWSYTMLPEAWRNFFKLNPMFYIVEGYRDTFINKIVFISHPYYTLYFWLFCLTVFSVGVKCLKRLKPHFADVI